MKEVLLMKKVLLIEDDPSDAELTTTRLGNEVNVIWVQSASQAFQMLDLDKEFNQIILDLGVAGSKLEDQERLYKDLSKYGVPIFAVTGDSRSEAKQRIELRGGKFALKDNIMQGDSLLAALGWLGSDLESQKLRASKHSKIVRGVEMRLSNLGKDIHELKERLDVLSKQVVENSETIIKLRSQLNQNKEKAKETQISILNLEKVILERMDTYEKALFEITVSNQNKAAQKAAHTTGFWQFVSALISAAIAAGVSILIAMLTLKK